jgi:hypothetical protein
VPLPDLKPKLAAAGTTAPIRVEIANALGRLRAERPRLADACEPAEIGRVVSAVLGAIDQACRQQFGLWTLEERRRYLTVWTVLRADGVDLGMHSAISGGGGYQREPNPHMLRTKRKEELLRLPWIMDMVERVVSHTYALLKEHPFEELVPAGVFPKGTGYCRITFFADE